MRLLSRGVRPCAHAGVRRRASDDARERATATRVHATTARRRTGDGRASPGPHGIAIRSDAGGMHMDMDMVSVRRGPPGSGVSCHPCAVCGAVAVCAFSLRRRVGVPQKKPRVNRTCRPRPHAHLKQRTSKRSEASLSSAKLSTFDSTSTRCTIAHAPDVYTKFVYSRPIEGGLLSESSSFSTYSTPVDSEPSWSCLSTAHRRQHEEISGFGWWQ